MKIIKKFYPLIITIVFCIAIYYFFQSDFKKLNLFSKFTFNLIIFIIFISLLYLVTEALVLRNILIFFKKETNVIETVALMTSNYLF